MDGLFRLDIVSQDDGMFVVKTGCVDGNGLKQVTVVSANKLEDVASDNPDKLKAEIAFLSTSIHSLQEALRSIAGAVGEFASADGKNIVEKIEFLRKDYEGRIKALEEENDMLRNITHISIPTKTMEQEFQKHYEKGYDDGGSRIKALEEAVEWADNMITASCDTLFNMEPYASTREAWIAFRNELRRRTGRDKP